MATMTEHPTIKRFRQARGQESDSNHHGVLDASWLRRLCLDAGADDAGFVEMGRPEIADQRDDILAVFPEGRTLVSIVCRMNRENIRSTARSVANLEFHHAGGEVVNFVWALLRRKIRLKGSPRLLLAFGRCFPS